MCLACLAAFSCGGASSSAPPALAPAASAGDEPPPVAAAPPAIRQEVQTGVGRLIVQASVDGKPIAAHARVLGGDRATEFEMGEEVSLEPGTRRIEVAVRDASALVDKPTQQLEVFIESGKTAKADVSFPFAKVQLNVMVGGHAQPGAVVKLLRNGSEVAELKTSAAPIYVSPGKYEADVVLHGTSVRVKGLTFLEGATQTVPVRAQF
jgi:hypothetical protein